MNSVQYGIRILIVSGCNSFRTGYKCRPRSNVRKQSIKHKLLHLFQHLLFRWLRLAYFLFTYEFLGIHRVNLGEFSSSAWIRLGRGIRAYRCCRDQSIRVITFVDCKVKSAESGISPLCFQIYFCTNTIAKHPAIHTKTSPKYVAPNLRGPKLVWVPSKSGWLFLGTISIWDLIQLIVYYSSYDWVKYWSLVHIQTQCHDKIVKSKCATTYKCHIQVVVIYWIIW